MKKELSFYIMLIFAGIALILDIVFLSICISRAVNLQNGTYFPSGGNGFYVAVLVVNAAVLLTTAVFMIMRIGKKH